MVYPDAFLQIPAGERASRAQFGDDWCRLRQPDKGGQRSFLRALMTFRVCGEQRPTHWSVWVEVGAVEYWRVMETWDEDEQTRQTRLPGQLANILKTYPPSLGLPGSIELRGAGTVPEFTLDGNLRHPLAVDQRSGVSPERVVAWISAFLH